MKPSSFDHKRALLAAAFMASAVCLSGSTLAAPPVTSVTESRPATSAADSAPVLREAPPSFRPANQPDSPSSRFAGHLEVRGEPGLEALQARIAARAPHTLARIRLDLDGLPSPDKVEIRLVKRAEDLTRVAPHGRGAPEWASGVAYPDLGIVAVATRRGPQPISVPNVVDHELAHLVLGAALRGRAPRWLDEGFAFLHASDSSVERVQLLTGMVWFGGITPLDELSQAFRGDQSQVDRAYAQSYDFVAFLARRGRYPDRHDDGNRWTFRRFLAEIAAGHSVYKAAHIAYGTGLNDLFEEWRRDLRNRYLLMPAGLFGLGVWVVAALLLMIGFARRRALNRRTLARWDREEQERLAAARLAAGLDGNDRLH
ncbi:MAG: hypothetical protein MJE77_19725 [Proteobacteria bacterium]|nr:hypothetical protein [Pseudomonadota bacterium]